MKLGLSLSLTGLIGGGAGNLDSVVSGVVFELSFVDVAGYPGSGATVFNITENPADGSNQSDYDFTLTGGTFTGTPGDPSAYMLLDNASYLTIAGGNTTFINSVHKAPGQDFCYIAVFQPQSGGSNQNIYSTRSSPNPGFSFIFDSSEQLRSVQYGTGFSALDTGLFVSGGTDSFVANGHDHTANSTTTWLNSSTGTVNAQTFSSTATNASRTLQIGADGAGGNTLDNNTRLYGLAVLDNRPDDATMAQIIAYYEAKHQRDYTP